MTNCPLWFVVLRIAVMKNSIFRDISPCSSMKVNENRRFPEDGGGVYFRNVGRILMDYKALHPRR